MTDLRTQIATLKVEGYDDNRAISAQIEAILKEQTALKARYDALEQEKQAAQNAFAQREQARTAKIEALQGVEEGAGNG